MSPCRLRSSPLFFTRFSILVCRHKAFLSILFSMMIFFVLFFFYFILFFLEKRIPSPTDVRIIGRWMRGETEVVVGGRDGEGRPPEVRVQAPPVVSALSEVLGVTLIPNVPSTCCNGSSSVRTQKERREKRKERKTE